MKVSVVLTVFNEEKSISALLDSLLGQTKKPESIIIVDGGSTDKTVEILRHYQQKDSRIKVLVEKCNRARGRNLGCEIAKEDIIAITDAGCVAQKDWLKNITDPFKIPSVDISAGFYVMTGGHPVNKAMSVFLGVTPKKFGINFLPSTRSMAFRKSAWEKVGGFPEGKGNSAEDTDFNYKAVKMELKYSRVKNALVEWGMPDTISDFQFKIYSYAKWDVQYGIWWHPAQRLASHNIHSLAVIVRYIFLLILLAVSILYHFPLFYCFIVALLYLIWAYRKVYLEFGEWKTSLWGPILQIAADIAVISGFISGFHS